MKKLLLFIIVVSFQLKAQDTIRFMDGKTSAVKVAEIGLEKIRYNRMDNVDGPVYIVDKSEVKCIKYANGSVDSFAVKKPTVVESTPDYVNSVPTEKYFEKILIVNKKLFYDHHGVNDRVLLELINDYPEPKTKSIMLREFAKLKTYKNNRLIGFAAFWGGIFVSVLGGAAGSSAVFLGGTGISIAGSVINTVNRNKYTKTKIDIAGIYNGDNPNDKNYDFR